MKDFDIGNNMFLFSVVAVIGLTIIIGMLIGNNYYTNENDRILTALENGVPAQEVKCALTKDCRS